MIKKNITIIMQYFTDNIKINRGGFFILQRFVLIIEHKKITF